MSAGTNIAIGPREGIRHDSQFLAILGGGPRAYDGRLRGGSSLPRAFRAPPPVYVPPAPIFTWTGVYIGGQIGYAWGQSNFNFSDDSATSPPSATTSTASSAAHVGYNLQLSQFVIGLEGDVDGTSVSRSRSQSLVLGGLPGEIDIDVSHNIEGSIRGRVGYAWDRVLVYATGGAAFGGFNTNVSANFATFIPNGVGGGSVFDVAGAASSSATRVGWTVGGGLEYAVTSNWSIRAEYPNRFRTLHDFHEPRRNLRRRRSTWHRRRY
ncbi:outer membrane protein [Methylocella sp.]|uniref:outer membrane protein n=1 Tax=Methylocella sp. TaxID=1978226 RepID=UPI003C22779A